MVLSISRGRKLSMSRGRKLSMLLEHHIELWTTATCHADHIRYPMPLRTHTRTHAHTPHTPHTHAHTTHTHARTHAHTHTTHARTHAHTPHTHTRTHAHTHTHRQQNFCHIFHGCYNNDNIKTIQIQLVS